MFYIVLCKHKPMNYRYFFSSKINWLSNAHWRVSGLPTWGKRCCAVICNIPRHVVTQPPSVILSIVNIHIRYADGIHCVPVCSQTSTEVQGVPDTSETGIATTKAQTASLRPSARQLQRTMNIVHDLRNVSKLKYRYIEQSFTLTNDNIWHYLKYLFVNGS